MSVSSPSSATTGEESPPSQEECVLSWARGQPDNWPDQPGEPEEDCLSLIWDHDGDTEWKMNDLDCQAKVNFVCKIESIHN